MFKQFNNLNFAPVDAPAASSGTMGKEDIIDFLGSDEEKEVIPLDDKKTDKKDIEDKDEEVEDEKEDETPNDELKEIEEELEEPSDEQLELVTPVRRKEILAKYPKLFKDFPYLEKAYYREQQFTELLPTIADAKEAVNKASTLDNIEQDLIDGNTEKILLAAKNDSKSFNKIVDNYLDVLAKVDKQAYYHVVGNTIKQTIQSMVSESNASNNDVLKSAAQILHQFVFGSSKWEPPTKLSKEEKPDSRASELEERERAFGKQKFEVANGDLSTRVNNSFRATIEANIDPKESMTDYNRRNAVRDAIETLEQNINSDTRFRQLVDKLWEKAAKEDYSKSSMDVLRSAFLSKARTLLPAVIKKARNEALRGMGKRVNNDSNDVDEPASEKRSPSVEKKEQSRSNRTSDNGKLKSGMTSLDYLMSDD